MSRKPQKPKSIDISRVFPIYITVYYILPKTTSLYAAIAFSWYWIHAKHPKIAFGFQKGDGYDVIADNHIELKKFAETLRMIK